MPIEIREIIIKTVVKSNNSKQQLFADKELMKQLKKELLVDCKKMLKNQTKKQTNKR